jgi:hypothetical protein
MRSAAATLAVAKYRPIRRSADMTTEPYRKVCSNCWQAVAAFQPRSQWCRPCVLDYQRRRRAAIKAGTWRPRPRSRSSDYPDAGSRERARRLQIVRDMIRVVEQRMERQQARMAALRAEEAALGDACGPSGRRPRRPPDWFSSRSPPPAASGSLTNLEDLLLPTRCDRRKSKS